MKKNRIVFVLIALLAAGFFSQNVSACGLHEGEMAETSETAAE